jgi:hypothetical protein
VWFSGLLSTLNVRRSFKGIGEFRCRGVPLAHRAIAGPMWDTDVRP